MILFGSQLLYLDEGCISFDGSVRSGDFVDGLKWIEYRHLPVLNRWLRRHIAGSIVLATGLATAWFRGFVFTPLAFMAVGLAMWVWGTLHVRSVIATTR